MQGLARAAAARGAQIFERSAAVAIQEDQHGWRVRTESGEIRASRLIQATNAYGTGGASANPVIPAHFFQLATAPLPQALRQTILSGGEGCWDTALIMSSFRLDDAGRMVFGALGNLDSFGGAVHRGWAKRKLVKLFPQLEGIAFAQSWTGRIGMTSTYLPRVQRRGKTGLSFFGFSGRGISPGTLFGRAAADWALGTDELPLALTDPQVEKNAAAKGLYYETGAALTHFTDGRL